MPTQELLAPARRQGSRIETPAVELADAARTLAVRATIDAADRLTVNRYAVRVYVSLDAGDTWRFVGGGEHAGLGPRSNRRTGLPELRPPRLVIDFDRPLPAGTLVKAEIDCPQELGLSLELET